MTGVRPVRIPVAIFSVLGFMLARPCSGACLAPFTMTLAGTFVIGPTATWFRALRHVVALVIAERVL